MEERNKREVVNRTALLALVDGDLIVLAELVEMFTPAYLKSFGQLQKAIAEKDASALRASAHAIKSLASDFYAGRAYDVAEELEQMGRRGNLETAKEVSEKLDAEIQAMKIALDQLIREKSS